MATVDNYAWGVEVKDPDTGKIHYDLSSLWDAISSTFPWKSVTGNTSEKIFRINDTLAISFRYFDNSSSGHTAMAVLVNTDTDSDIKSLWQGNLSSSSFSPKDSSVQIIKSATGDCFVRLRANNQSTFRDNSDFVFGVVRTIDGVTKEQTGLYGIYIPQNSSYIPFDYSPQYLITEDTTNVIANTGYAGGSAMTAYKCILNPDAPFTALSPIITVGNKNISQTSYVMMIGKSAKMGPFILDGKYYYGISGFCMYDGDVGDGE